MDFFKRHFLVPLIAVLGLVAIAYIGVAANLQLVFGVVIPYLAVLIFFEGLIFRVISWARSPVPFKIPSTCAQGKTLPWIKRDLADKLDNPENKLQVFGRMALEVLAFRSLFRNTRSELQRNQEKPEDSRLIYWSYKWLWLGALAFHYAFLLVILRHIRFFAEPVPHWVTALAEVDGFVQFYIPTVYLTGVLMVVGLTVSAGPPHLHSDLALHLPGRGLLSPAAHHCHRRQRHPDALCLQSRYRCRAAIGPRFGQLQAGGARRHRCNLLYPSLLSQCAVCLLSLQQTDARARGLFQPHPEYGRGQSLEPACQSLELSRKVP